MVQVHDLRVGCFVVLALCIIYVILSYSNDDKLRGDAIVGINRPLRYATWDC